MPDHGWNAFAPGESLAMTADRPASRSAWDGDRVFRALPASVFVWHRSGDDFVLVDANDAAHASTGGAVRRVFGTTATALIGDRPHALDDLDACWREQRTVRRRVDVVFGAAGDVRPLDITCIPAGTDTVLVHALDLTELRAAEREAWATNERFRLGFETAPTPLAITDLEGRFLDVNPALARMLDRPIGEVLTTSFVAVADYDFRNEVVAGLHGLVHERTSLYAGTWRFLRPDGSEVWGEVTSRVVPGVDGAPDTLFSQIQDVTEVRRANAAILESEARYRSLVELAPAAIVIHVDGVFVYANAAAIALLGGRDAGDIVGHHVSTFFVVPESGRPKASDLVPGRPARTRERLRRRDGVVVDIDISALPITYDGRPAVQVVASDVTERVSFEAALEHQATHDPLTGLPNRLHLDRAVQAALQEHRPVTVLFVDLDRFKLINDTFGHAAGDAVLVQIGERLRSLRADDEVVSRFGGDSFTILCPGIGDDADVAAVAQRYLLAASDPVTVDGREFVLAASAGVAVAHTACDVDAETLLRQADTAMYRAKEAGGGRWSRYDEGLHVALRRRLDLEGRLRRALDAGDVTVAYQPIIDLRSGRIEAVEALARWTDPDLGPVSPADFIPVAEDSGLIVPLGRQVLASACHQVARWNQERTSPLGLAVNISARQLAEPGLAATVRGALAGTGLPAELLELEITESLLMAEHAAYHRVLDELDADGVRFAIDDFGTGYSSLAYLKRFPVRALKIDRGFVSGLLRPTEDHALVVATIELAHALGLAAVAEGVEQEAQRARLVELGCDMAQGYLWSRPLPAGEIEWLLLDRSSTTSC